MVQRVVATSATLEVLARLHEQHGSGIILFQSAGCCEGSAPMCYLPGELTLGDQDRLLGYLGSCPFYIGASQYEYWQHTQLIIDVEPGSGDTFSLEGPLGVHFLTRSRLWTEAELSQLSGV